MYYKIIIALLMLLISSCSLNLSHSVKDLSFDNKNQNYHILYPDTTNNEYLRTLRQTYRLDSLILKYTNELDKIKALLHWTHNQWEHSGSNIPSKPDALMILKEAKHGNNFRCVEYGIVSAAVLNSVGIPSRMLALKTANVELAKSGAGHVVAEVYSDKFKKWIFIDGQFDIIPMLNDIPLNAIEFQHAISHDKKNLKLVNIEGEISEKEKKKYLKWIAKYLFYFDISFDQRNIPSKEKLRYKEKSRLMLVPLRAKNPTLFQKKTKLDFYIYTNNSKDFYQIP